MTKRLLAEFGENRLFSSEGGRTNRGLAGEIQTLLEQLKKAKLDTLPKTSRNEVLTSVEKWLVSKVGEYFNQARVRFIYKPENTAWQAVHDLLEVAREVGKEGQVAQYLVGAKLQVRFPKLEIRNDSFSTSDAQSGSPGDFLVSDTAFHVTVSPTPNHFERCKDNLRNGYRPYLIVPDRVLQGTRQNSENALPGQITTQSLESFVSQNIEELSTFSRDELTKGFRLILETYNKRVDAAETDKSLLIEIPRNI